MAHAAHPARKSLQISFLSAFEIFSFPYGAHATRCGMWRHALLCSQRPAKEPPSSPPPKALFGCIQIHSNPHGLGGIEVEFVRRQKSPNKRQQLP